MQYDEFLNRLSKDKNITSREEALRVGEAALTTLGERLSEIERGRLAAQLPNELKQVLLRNDGAQDFPLEEYYARVRARSQVEGSRVEAGSRAVFSVLKEAVSPGELEDVLAQLPGEYGELFSEAPRVPLTPPPE